jgi:hypothetical protein
MISTLAVQRSPTFLIAGNRGNNDRAPPIS